MKLLIKQGWLIGCNCGTFSMSARRFSEVGAVQFRRRVGIGILQGWLGV